jgi:hypothetical protein
MHSCRQFLPDIALLAFLWVAVETRKRKTNEVTNTTQKIL